MAEYEATMAMAAFTAPEVVGVTPPAPMDILDVVEPSAQMKAEMRMATKTPSEWLRLLCRDWSLENESIVAATDSRFLQYKSYLKGQLTSQLLCRLSISGNEGSGPREHMASLEVAHDPTMPALPPTTIDFWKILGVDDEFDRAHIVANIERFCSLYNIRGGTLDEPPLIPGAIDNPTVVMGNNYYPDVMHMDTAAAAAAAAGMSMPPPVLLYPMDHIDASAPAAKMQHVGGTKIRQTVKSQERRLKAEMREREREAYSVRKAADKAARVATREESRQRKLTMRKQREEFAQKQKEAALRRAAELVQSNRVPIEITRGAAAALAAANAAVANAAIPAAEVPAPVVPSIPMKKGRSSIVISTASDLDQIVTHSNNLWAKYNAIAKEHNQKVNWIVVAKELGIHVKVREKYARMHARANARGFDFVNWGHYRIKDYPQFFLDPLGPVSALEPAKIEELGGKQASLEGGTHQQHQPVPETILIPGSAINAVATGTTGAVAIQPSSMNDVHEIPNRDMMMLAAEAAGVVGDGTAYSDDPAMVVAAVAAAAVQQHQYHQPMEISGDEAHVVPPLPQDNDMLIDEMKTVESPSFGGTAAV
mmetsp:Transcript_30896/g.57214  ORF Transcript_30896/g.57214 Transcript_30896/m.57214 type:complete len:594 (+) Transcript_30896:329-2110(+)